MAHKTFISYKYFDEGQAGGARDQIIEALGQDAIYYQGESGFSDDMGGFKTETIKDKLSDMLFDTSVLIVLISSNVDQSKWVQWEIDYATHKSTRNGRQSQPDGVVIVVKDSLIDSKNKYHVGIKVTKEVKEAGVPYIQVGLSRFLSSTSSYIDDVSS